MPTIQYRTEIIGNTTPNQNSIVELKGVFYYKLINLTGNPANLEITTTGRKTLNAFEEITFHTGNPEFRFADFDKIKLVPNTTTTNVEVEIGFVE